MQESDILVVDDRPENLLAVEAILGHEPGYRLTRAASGGEALKAVLRVEFAVILLDQQLPDLDGFEVARLIKLREKSRDTPILFLTANTPDSETLAKAYSMGAADFLTKPVSPEIVRAKVAVFVELFRKTQQLRDQSALLHESEKQRQELQLAELRTMGERRYRHLAESIPQIVWRALPDGRVEYWNQRWFDYTGGDAEMSSEGAWAFLHPEDREKVQAAWQAARKDGTALQCECRILRKDGQYRWHLRRALPERAPEGEVTSWLGTDTDIDDRKRADDDRIELLVRERAARFEAEAAQKRAAQLYVEARDAVQLRDEFLTVAAHELRTPLTTLRLLVQMMSKQKPEDARTLVRSVERLCTLIDQLLDVSRIAGGQLRLELQATNLRDVVAEVAGRMQGEAERNGCAMRVEDGQPVKVVCDPMRIEQVVANLLTNAIKYGRGKPIELQVANDESTARLVVRDHGIGVAPEEHGRIFERFARAVSVREYGGLGLGLYIARQIVEAHGGNIRVASSLGDGSTFSVEIPVSPLVH